MDMMNSDKNKKKIDNKHLTHQKICFSDLNFQDYFV